METTNNTYSTKIHNNDGTYSYKNMIIRDKLDRYKYKMEKYRQNCIKRNNKKLEEDKKYEDITITITNPFEIRKSKPKASKGVKTDIIFKWSEAALNAKKSLHNQKIKVEKHFKDKNEQDHKIVYYRQPSINDVYFDELTINDYILPTHKERKEAKKAKYETLPFSDFHKKLVTYGFYHYSPSKNRLRYEAWLGEHNAKIRTLMDDLHTRKQKHSKYRFEVITQSKDGNLRTLMCNYSNKEEHVMINIVSSLARNLNKHLTNFHHIKLFNNQTNKLVWVDTGSLSKEHEEAYNKLHLNKLRVENPNYYAA